ncbi:MAG: hypothetical protein R2747_18930 [Pyrinomonadaceae bacterium]
MIWTIEYIEKQNYLKITREGKFGIAEHLNMFEEILLTEPFRPGMPLFFDNRDLEFGKVDFPTMHRAAGNYQKMSEKIGHGKAVMLMRKTSLDFGYGRQFQVLCQSRGLLEFGVFTDEEVALKWLLRI